MGIVRRLLHRVTITSVGVAALVLGVLAAVLDHREATAGFDVSGFVDAFFRGNGGTLLGIGFTVLILDQLYKRREDRDRKALLTRALGSPDRTAALTALETLRTEEWLDDGTLRGAGLREARLTGADLMGADLRAADLSRADLAGARLRRANLGGTDLGGADLSRADLARASLDGARLRDAALAGADLSRTDVTSHQLATAHSLLDATMPDRQRYDGRYDLAGDRDLARRLGFSVDDTTAMARFYAVPLSRYEAGRAVPV